MQIKNIVLYKTSQFKPRILPFKLGVLNIITGESSTGKTAVLDIVNYCLGSDEFHVKGEKIKSNVTWFAITIVLNNEEVFIARKNPSLINQKTTNQIFWIKSNCIIVPKYIDLVNNSNISTLNIFISNQLGINDNLHVAKDNTRESLEATFKHSRVFSFQPQNIIAEFKYLFFNQDNSYITQAIKDTLPYILGAIREDELLILQKIRALQKELNKYLRKQKIEESIKTQSLERLNTLVEEAKELELINIDFEYQNDDEAIQELYKVLKLDGAIQGISPEYEQVNRLLEKKKKVRNELFIIRNEIKSVNNFIKDSSSYTKELSSQHDRLLSLELYKEPTDMEYWNSLLGKEVDTILPSIMAMNNSLKQLQDNLQFSKQEKFKTQKIIIELEEKRDEKVTKIKNIDRSLQNIYKQNEELKKIKNIDIKKGRVLGRISLFFESIKFTVSSSDFNKKISNLTNNIQELESMINQEEKENKINTILNKINIIMTSWNKKLTWEHQEDNLRFDIKKLTLFADTDKKSESLQEMGSGENWLACHLIVHLALHKYFIDTKRPVPNFIIFDQPTQVHYPEEYKESSSYKLDSKDEIADKKMFKFIFEVAKELSPNLQIIITDHADFDDEYFQDAIVEKWRGGKKLVPLEWIDS